MKFLKETRLMLVVIISLGIGTLVVYAYNNTTNEEPTITCAIGKTFDFGTDQGMAKFFTTYNLWAAFSKGVLLKKLVDIIAILSPSQDDKSIHCVMDRVFDYISNFSPSELMKLLEITSEELIDMGISLKDILNGEISTKEFLNALAGVRWL